MLYFSRVAIDPDRIDTNQIKSLKAFRKNTYPKGLVETYQKLSGFRDKFSRQLEITIRDLQKAELSGPIPLSLTFLSVQDGKSIGSDLKITYRRPIVSDFGAVPPDLVDEVKKMVENKIKRELFHPIALGIQNSGLTGIRNPYLKIEFTPDNVDLELSDNFPSRRSRWLTTRISKFWLSSQFVDLDDDDDGSGDDTVSKMKEIFQEFEFKNPFRNWAKDGILRLNGMQSSPNASVLLSRSCLYLARRRLCLQFMQRLTVICFRSPTNFGAHALSKL